MEQRKCGQEGLSLSVLGVGCWAFGGGAYWGDQDQRDVDAVVHRAIDLGVNFFDTAEVYNDGRSEEALGRALKSVDRDRVVIGSKVSPDNCYRQTLVEHCEASLKRLGTDRIDVYMVHWPIHPRSIRHFTNDEAVIDHPPSVSEAVEAMNELKQQGKILHAGVSNFSEGPLGAVRDAGLEVAVNQLGYSLLARAIELDVLPLCEERGIGVIGYSTLMQGILSGKFATLADVPANRCRTRQFRDAGDGLARHGGEGFEPLLEEALQGIRGIAAASGLSMAALATGWAVAHPAMTCALAGARNAEQMEVNAAALASPLSDDLVDALNGVTQPLRDAMGPGFDYFESIENDRTVGE